MVWDVKAIYIRQQNASKCLCLNTGSVEVNYLSAVLVVVGQCGCSGKGFMVAVNG